MRALHILFFLVMIVVMVLSIVYAAPESTGQCHDESLNLTVKPGEVAYPEGKCMRVTCSDEGKIRMDACEFAIGPNCHVVDGDLSKQYPACCSTVKCD